jgi:hypothetical protein
MNLEDIVLFKQLSQEDRCAIAKAFGCKLKPEREVPGLLEDGHLTFDGLRVAFSMVAFAHSLANAPEEEQAEWEDCVDPCR